MRFRAFVWGSKAFELDPTNQEHVFQVLRTCVRLSAFRSREAAQNRDLKP